MEYSWNVKLISIYTFCTIVDCLLNSERKKYYTKPFYSRYANCQRLSHAFSGLQCKLITLSSELPRLLFYEISTKWAFFRSFHELCVTRPVCYVYEKWFWIMTTCALNRVKSVQWFNIAKEDKVWLTLWLPLQGRCVFHKGLLRTTLTIKTSM